MGLSGSQSNNLGYQDADGYFQDPANAEVPNSHYQEHDIGVTAFNIEKTKDNLNSLLTLDKTRIFSGTSEVKVLSVDGDISVKVAGVEKARFTPTGLDIFGSMTSVNTTNLEVTDSLISLAKNNNGADIIDIGFYGLYDTSGTQDLYCGLFRNASDNKFHLFVDSQELPSMTVNTGGIGYTRADLIVGGIGVNTDTPAKKIHIEQGDILAFGNGRGLYGGNVAGIYHFIAGYDSTGAPVLGNTNNSTIIKCKEFSTERIAFVAGSTEHMRMTGDGLFGIGTTVPSHDLQVVGTTRTDTLLVQSNVGQPQIRANIVNANSGTGNYAILGIGIEQNLTAALDLRTHTTLFTTAGAYKTRGSSIITHGNLSGGLSIGAIAGNFEIYTGGTNTANNRITVLTTGEVGINTLVPTEILDITGNIKLSGYQNQVGMSAPAISPVGNGRIYFDSTSNTYKVSENNGAYVDLVGGGGGGGVDVLNIQIATTTTVTVTDTDNLVRVDTTLGAITVNLPDIDNAGITDGHLLVVKDRTGNASVNNVTIIPNATVTADTIDESNPISPTNTYILNTNYESVTFRVNKTNRKWEAI